RPSWSGSTRAAGSTTGSAPDGRRGTPAKGRTSRPSRRDASPSRRCISTSLITIPSRRSSRSRRFLATAPSKNDPDYPHVRELMVDRHVKARGVNDERVLQAMRAVPRHLFVPTLVASKAYGPGALPIGAKQTISQPYIVGRMIELLELRGTEKVLEIGTGT